MQLTEPTTRTTGKSSTLAILTRGHKLVMSADNMIAVPSDWEPIWDLVNFDTLSGAVDCDVLITHVDMTVEQLLNLDDASELALKRLLQNRFGRIVIHGAFDPDNTDSVQTIIPINNDTHKVLHILSRDFFQSFYEPGCTWSTDGNITAWNFALGMLAGFTQLIEDYRKVQELANVGCWFDRAIWVIDTDVSYESPTIQVDQVQFETHNLLRDERE
jgi:hypothetical protein